MGTIGWQDDDVLSDIGTGENSGYTLIKVQLYRGRDNSKPIKDLDPTVGHGHKILCQMASNIGRIPPKGVRCFVAYPSGFEDAVNIGLIIGTIEKNSSVQLKEDRALLNYGDQHLVIKAKSVTIADQENRFMCIGVPRAGGTPGIIFQSKDGCGGVIQEGVVSWFTADGGTVKSVLELTTTAANLVQSDGSFVKLKGGKGSIGGTSVYATGGAVYLGTLPSPASPALYGLTGIAGIASLSVFLSP